MQGKPVTVHTLATARVLIQTYEEVAAIQADRLEAYEAALRAAPIVSQYHSQYGFEVEKFLIDYAAWKHNARKALSDA